MSSKPSLIILAAGLGTRFGGDKQTCRIGNSGEFLLEYNISNALRSGIKNIVIVVGMANRDFIRENLSYLEKRCNITYIVQEQQVSDENGKSYSRKKPWGTGHAVLSALRAIEGRAIVINADDYYGRDPFKKAISFTRSGDPKKMGLVAFRLNNTLSEFGSVARGICLTDEKENLLSVSEQEEIKIQNGLIFSHNLTFEGDERVSMNFWILNRDFLSYLEKRFSEFLENYGTDENREFQLPVQIDHSIRENLSRFHLMETSGPWFGLTYQEDTSAVKDLLRQKVEKGEYASDLRKTS